MAFGTESIAPVDVIVGPGQPLRGRGQAPGVGRGRGGLGLRRPVRGGGHRRRRTPRPSWPPSTWSSRPSTAPTDWPGWSPGRRRWPTRSTAEVDRLVAALAPAGRPRGHARKPAGYVVLVDGPDAGLRGRQRRGPRAPRAPRRRRRVAAAAGATRPARSSSGPCSPASVGDYLAGPNHVLPTNRTARFASALRVDDFRAPHPRRVRRARRRWRELGTARGDPGRDRGPARPRRVGAPPMAAVRPTGRAALAGAPAPPRSVSAGRLSLGPGRGGGAAQHQRVAPAAARRMARRAAGPSWPTSTSTATPTASATELRRGAGRAPRRRPEPGVLCQRFQRGAAVPAAGLRRAGPDRRRLRADLHPAPPHRPDHRHRRWSPAGADRRLPARPRRGRARSSTPAQPVDHVPVLAQQPDRAGRARPRPWRTVLERGAGPGGGGRGLRAVRPVVARSIWWRRAARARDRLVVVRTFSKTWSMAAAAAGLPGRRPRRGRRPASWWPCPTTSTRSSRLAGRLALRLRRRDGGPGGPASREERGRIAAALAELPVETWPSDANFILFRPTDRAGPPGVARTSSTRRCSCETVRSGRGSPGASGSRWDSRGERPLPGRTAPRGPADDAEERRT